MQPVVQVAIDVTSMEEAMSLAKSPIRAGADWLEAGTPCRIVTSHFMQLGWILCSLGTV